MLLVAGSARLDLWAPEEGSRTVDVQLVAGDNVVDIAFPRRDIPISGFVTGLDHMPLARVTVQAVPLEPGPPVWTQTDERGYYTVMVSSGTCYQVAFQGVSGETGFTPGEWRCSAELLQVNGPTSLDLALPAARVRGILVTHGGTAVAGAAISATSNGGEPGGFSCWSTSRAPSDAEGRFTLVLVKGWANLQVSPPPDSGLPPLDLSMSLSGDLDQTFVLGEPTDTTAPQLLLPDALVAEATSPAGAPVEYTVTATDNTDPSPAVSCDPPPVSTFALGATVVTCTAVDVSGNTSSGTFTVTVRDTTPPALILPGDQEAEATSPAGATVVFSATATDAVDSNPAVTCDPPSGSTFALGATTVTCAGDHLGRRDAIAALAAEAPARARHRRRQREGRRGPRARLPDRAGDEQRARRRPRRRRYPG